MLELVDTYSTFEQFYLGYNGKDSHEKLDGWLEYMRNFPELKEKCINDYVKSGYDWKKVALESVFPQLDNSINEMEEAHDIILKNLRVVSDTFYTFFPVDESIYVVIYYGLGNGAGWATDYMNRPAVLLGLDKIAELYWTDELSIKGLIFHELSHIAHRVLRGDIGNEKNLQDNGIWRLYEEGFAQRYEQVLMGSDFFHQDREGWLDWCRRNHIRLLNMYIECLDKGEPVRDFFGDWNSIEGHSDTGYFLGAEFIRYLQGFLSAREITTLSLAEVRNYLNDYYTVLNKT